MTKWHHTIHGHHAHTVWDRDLAPVLEVDPGEAVEFEVADASGGQVDASSTAEALTTISFDSVNPVTGPIFVRGATPGTVLEVEVLEFGTTEWGWTGVIPGFGLLAEEFPEPWLKIWDVRPGRRAVFDDGVTVPLAPFAGTIGVAPAAPGPHSIVPPRAVGGNLDIKHLTAGTKLYLPVAVEGALFSVGDTHAAQGDGEVCGTAIESPMRVALRFAVRRDLTLTQPAFETFGSAPGDGANAAGSVVSTGVDSDLIEASRTAVRNLVSMIVERSSLGPYDAYALASVAADLRIHEVVDVPNWVVGAWLPKHVIRGLTLA